MNPTFSQAQLTVLNQVRVHAPGGEVLIDHKVLPIATRKIFPFIRELASRKIDLTPKNLRAVLLRARELGVLRPYEAKVGRRNAQVLIADWQRRQT